MVPNLTDRKKCVSFSGHRIIAPPPQGDLFGEKFGRGQSGRGQDGRGQDGLQYDWEDGPEDYRRMIEQRLEAAVERLCGEGYGTFICGMAEGFDLMAAGVVVRARKMFPGLRLVAAIPCPEHERFIPLRDREQYRELILAADEVVAVSPRYSPDCFHRRNDYLTDNAGVLICFYNGSKGGTAYTVKRAMRAGLRILNVM